MTTPRLDQPLSRLELILLARMSAPSVPKNATLESVATEWVAVSSDSRAAQVRSTLESLRRRGQIHPRKNQVTEGGRQTLRAALGATNNVQWRDVPELLATKELGITHGAAAANDVLASGRNVASAVLCQQLALAPSTDIASIPDALIAKRLGMPASVNTIDEIRAHVLSQATGLELEAVRKNHRRADLVRMLTEQALKTLKLPVTKAGTKKRPQYKALFVQALGKNWLAKLPPAQLVQAGQIALPVGASPPQPLVAQSRDLLSIVRDTIPRVGPDGRFGMEKIFVSALWNRLEKHLLDLSLEHFKRWLVTENQKQHLTLARADLTGAMDQKLRKASPSPVLTAR